MRLELIIGAMLLGSVAVGFALNRFFLRRIAPGRKKEIAFAISRAVFYAPSIVHVGHGAYIPLPLLIALESSLHEFGAELNVLVFLFPSIVFLGSLATAWLFVYRRAA